MKKFRKIISLFLFGLTFVLGSCDMSNSGNDKGNTNNTYDPVSQMTEIYLSAVEKGYNGTYDEWLNKLKGDQIEIRSYSGYIQWKYTNSSMWTNLVPLSEIMGKDSIDGLTPYIGENGNWWICC